MDWEQEGIGPVRETYLSGIIETQDEDFGLFTCEKSTP